MYDFKGYDDVIERGGRTYVDVQVPQGYPVKHKQYDLREIQDDLNYFYANFGPMKMVHIHGVQMRLWKRYYR